MTQALLFGSATGTKAHTAAQATSLPESVAVTWVQFTTRLLLKCHGSQKAALRKKVAEYLAKAENSARCVDELLLICSTEGGPDGLDAAIDILAMTGELVLEYAWDYLKHDIVNWSPDANRAYKPNDDYWYVLLRAVGRTAAEEKDRYRFIACCGNASARGIRESVIEGLRDLGTSTARARLQTFANNDSNEHVRQAAKDALADLEA